MPIARRAAAQNIRNWREGLGWSPKDLARRAGVSYGTVRNLEDENAHSPKLYSLSRVCTALGVEPFTALVPGVSEQNEASATLAQLVAYFLACNKEGQAEILRSAQREARYTKGAAATADVEVTSPLTSSQ